MDIKFKDIDATGKPCHLYTINDIPVPSVTSITGILPKPWLAPWASKTCAENMIANLRNLEGAVGLPVATTTDVMKKYAKHAQGAWSRKRDKAADKGVQAHAWAEKYIKTGQMPDLPLLDKEVLNSVQLFLDWESKNQVKWLHSEIFVGSEEYMFAGKFDAIAWIMGHGTCLIDFKTSTGIYDEHRVQVHGGYKLCCDEMYQKKIGNIPLVQNSLILWIPKTGNDFKAEIVQIPQDLCKRVFLDAKNLYLSLKALDKV